MMVYASDSRSNPTYHPAAGGHRVVAMEHTHTLSTNTLRPHTPTARTQVAMEVGERRLVARRPVHVYFGDEVRAFFIYIYT